MAKAAKRRPAPVDPVERARALVARMTLPEKVGQMLYNAEAIPRLGIPAYNWWNEALHGVARAGRATVFPQSIGLAATFDEPLVERVFDAVSTEARAKHQASVAIGYRGIYGGLTFWTPNINIFRDPRWGRGQETYGEDPVLTARMGCAVVRGLQGDHPQYLKTAACAKHYAVHSGPEKLRHGFDAQASPRDLAETYLPAFEALVREAGVEAVMGAYNRTNGEPCCASPTLMGLLKQWGFQGHFVSDCGALDDFHNHHKVTKDAEESAALAVAQGCDLNCGATYHAVLNAVERGLLTEAQIDACVVRLMTTRIRLGLFDAPKQVPWSTLKPSVIDSPKHRALALEAARRSITLLKNGGILPLKRDIPSLHVTGPAANEIDVLLGNYNGTNPRVTTILQGILAIAHPGTAISHSRGCGWTGTNTGGFAHGMHYVLDAGQTRTVIACVGNSSAVEGEEGDAAESDAGGDRVHLGLPGVQEQWLRRLKDCGCRLIVVLTGGSAISCPWVMEHADAVLQCYYPGEEGGTAVAEVLFGLTNPAGRLPFTVPTGPEQLPPFEDYAMAGRTYRYSDAEPLLPFGFGLSYTTFAYRGLKVAKPVIAADGIQVVTVTVQNTGTVAGDEVVQCYLADVAASVPVPRRTLVAFTRIHLKPKQKKTVRLAIDPRHLRCFADDGTPMVEPGEFRVWVGGGQPGAERWGGATAAEGTFRVG